MNYSFFIKRVFLSFAQQYFLTKVPNYKWTSGIDTKIIIADKSAENIDPHEMRPMIILSRGAYGWEKTSIGQMKNTNVFGDRFSTTFNDLIRGAVTFNCIARHGLQAEELANFLFIALSFSHY